MLCICLVCVAAEDEEMENDDGVEVAQHRVGDAGDKGPRTRSTSHNYDISLPGTHSVRRS
jgi:hypothetical protein